MSRWFVVLVFAGALSSACVGSRTELLGSSRQSAGDGGIGTRAGELNDAGATRDASGDEADVFDAGSPPTSTSISVAPLALVPPFDTGIHDYYVRCIAGTNELTVTMTAAPGESISLAQPVTTPSGVYERTAVSLLENDALVVNVSSDAGTAPYWIRCLPHNFPQLQMLPHPDAGAPTPGYYLVGDVASQRGEGAYGMALDGNGVPVWYHTTATGRGPVDVDSVVPGMMSFVAFLDYTFNTTSGAFELHDLAAHATFSVEPSGTPLDVHELQYLPSGDYLVISDPIIGEVNLTGLGTFGPSSFMIGCVLQQVSATGVKEWEWNITDHFDAVKDSTWPQVALVSHVNVADPFHCNSVDVDEDGDLLVSARHMDSVFKISKQTGKVLWKMGGATYSKDGAPYIAVTNDPETAFYRQHDARFLGSNQVSMFDDHTEMPGPARGVIYSYDTDAGTATVAWQYQGTVSTTEMGSFRVTGDGSRVIGWGVGGAPDRAITEVDESGTPLLDFDFPDGDGSYRAIKIPTTTFDKDLLRRTAGTD